MSFRTVEWKNNKVVMIDQTKLPNELIFVEYDDFNQVANAIKTLIVRGAPAIGVSGAFGLGLAALQSKATTKDELLSDLEEARKHLNIKLTDIDEITRCDAVILAVAHDKYTKFTKKQWQKMFNCNGVFIDVKSIYDRDYFADTNLTHWRL